MVASKKVLDPSKLQRCSMSHDQGVASLVRAVAQFRCYGARCSQADSSSETDRKMSGSSTFDGIDLPWEKDCCSGFDEIGTWVRENRRAEDFRLSKDQLRYHDSEPRVMQLCAMNNVAFQSSLQLRFFSLIVLRHISHGCLKMEGGVEIRGPQTGIGMPRKERDMNHIVP